MEALVDQRKSLVLILVKQRQNSRVYITIMIIVISVLTEKKSISLKKIIKISTFPNPVCLGSIYNKFDFIKSTKVYSK